MNRRSFFGLLSGAAAGVALADGLLELAGDRKIFLPPHRGWVSSKGGIFYSAEFSKVLRNSMRSGQFLSIMDRSVTLLRPEEVPQTIADFLLNGEVVRRSAIDFVK